MSCGQWGFNEGILNKDWGDQTYIFDSLFSWLRETIWKAILIVQREAIWREYEEGMDFGNI